jgi:hypothetical protein
LGRGLRRETVAYLLEKAGEGGQEREEFAELNRAGGAGHEEPGPQTKYIITYNDL